MYGVGGVYIVIDVLNPPPPVLRLYAVVTNPGLFHDPTVVATKGNANTQALSPPAFWAL